MWAYVKETKKLVALVLVFQVLGLPAIEAEEFLVALSFKPFDSSKQAVLPGASLLIFTLWNLLQVVGWLIKNYGILKFYSFSKFLTFLL